MGLQPIPFTYRFSKGFLTSPDKWLFIIAKNCTLDLRSILFSHNGTLVNYSQGILNC